MLTDGSGSVGQVRYLDKFPLTLSSESQAKQDVKNVQQPIFTRVESIEPRREEIENG